MIEAFVDESGTHRGSPILSVGLFGGTHDNWKIFLDKWGDRYFHAKESPKYFPRYYCDGSPVKVAKCSM